MTREGRTQVGRTQRRKRPPDGSATARERAFVEGVAVGKTDKRAALDAGYALSVAENTKFKLWSKPQVQEYFQRVTQSVAPPERVLRNLSELLDGKVTTTKQRRIVDARGNTTETTVERTETVDLGVKLRTTIEAAEWAGYVPSKRPEIVVNALTQIQLRPTSELEAMLLDVNRRLTGSVSDGNKNANSGEPGPRGAAGTPASAADGDPEPAES